MNTYICICNYMNSSFLFFAVLKLLLKFCFWRACTEWKPNLLELNLSLKRRLTIIYKRRWELHKWCHECLGRFCGQVNIYDKSTWKYLSYAISYKYHLHLKNLYLILLTLLFKSTESDLCEVQSFSNKHTQYTYKSLNTYWLYHNKNIS